MATPITVPRLGWNMEQGVFLGWLKADGDAVRAGDALFTLESEKAAEQIENFDEGILHIPINGPREGDIVAVGAVIGFVLQPGETPDAASRTAGGQSKDVDAKPDSAIDDAAIPIRVQQSQIPDPSSSLPASSPRARRAAENLGVSWQDATGSGQTGRIRERDVVELAATSRVAPASPASSTRRVIAERMLNSHRSTAPVTLMSTIDATKLVKFREHSKAAAEIVGEIVPSFNDLFVKLTAHALEKHPALNSRWENDRIVSPEGIHIGIAVDTEAGLLVPVLRDVTRLSLRELAVRSRDLIDRARLRKLSANELQGGTFTVTSLGGFGIDAFTPIINYPECAILGIGRIRRVPAVLDDQIVIRDQVTLSLTFDHRITDGAPAARFLQSLSAAVENPKGLS